MSAQKPNPATWRVICADVMEGLAQLPDESIQCVVTSPPYWGLRDYGTAVWEGGDALCDHAVRASVKIGSSTLNGRKATTGHQREGYHDSCARCGARRVDQQLGLEPTLEAYVERMVAVFREVRRVLRPDGTVWLNLGDSYVSSARGNRDGDLSTSSLTNPGRQDTVPRPDGRTAQRASRSGISEQRGIYGRFEGLKPKDLVGIPWRVARALQEPYYTGKIRDERDRIWLAAIVDGEGCIHIHRRPAGQAAHSKYVRKDGTTANYVRTQDTFGVMVSVDNTSLALVDRCQELAGGLGSRYTHEAGVGKSNRKQTLYRWTITGQQARDLIQEVYPHLVAKPQQARIAFHSPSSGESAREAHEAVKALHGGTPTDVDYPAPPTLFEPGWYLRAEIIWGKSNPMPESVTDRPTKAHEQVFLLSKQPRYFYDADAVRTAYAAETKDLSFEMMDFSRRDEYARVKVPGGWDQGDGAHGTIHRDGRTERTYQPAALKAGANLRSVWSIATEPYPEAHFATFPKALVVPCVKAGTSEKGCCPECGAAWVRETSIEYVKSPVHGAGSVVGRHEETGANGWDGAGLPRVNKEVTTTGWRSRCTCIQAGDYETQPTSCTVLDPFAGSGTVGVVALRHGRSFIGIELNPTYAEMARERIRNDAPLFNHQAEEVLA